jgi:hypothetical protein
VELDEELVSLKKAIIPVESESDDSEVELDEDNQYNDELTAEEGSSLYCLSSSSAVSSSLYWLSSSSAVSSSLYCLSQ